MKITDISLRYAPYWHLFLHGCEEVQIRDVNIKGEPRQFTNDGIDIDWLQACDGKRLYHRRSEPTKNG